MQTVIRNLTMVIDELLNLSHVLQGDAVQNYQAMLADYENQVNRRSFVRSCWAYVEAVTFSVKQYTFSVCQMGTVNISQDDHAFLGDMLVVVDVEGNIQIQRDPTKTLANVKRTFRLSAQIFGVDWKPNFGSKGWENLRDSLQIRHRLTHPKSVAEVMVSSNDIQIQKDGIDWFVDCFHEYLESILKHPMVQANPETRSAN